MRVYVVESGDYEARTIYYVADSLETAFAAIKLPYTSPPYLVRWGEPVLSPDGSASLTGHFE